MSQDLTAHEMFDLLLAGKKVGQVAQCSDDPSLIRLVGHLNVIKHRSRKIYESLGLEWSNSVIKCSPKISDIKAGEQLVISLSLPSAPKKYASFIIIDDNDQLNQDDISFQRI